MNSTYIHLRANSQNIYMYMGEYTNNPLEKYNNRKY
jgi:hypothetical protein